MTRDLARPESETQLRIDYTQHAAGRPGAGADRARSTGRRILGTQQDPHSRHSHLAQEVARYSGPEETAPSKTDMNKLIERKLKSERTMELDRGRWEATQLQELRGMLSCATSEQQGLSQEDAKHQLYLGNGQKRSARHW